MKQFPWIIAGICIFLGGLAFESPVIALIGLMLVVLLLIGSFGGKGKSRNSTDAASAKTIKASTDSTSVKTAAGSTGSKPAKGVNSGKTVPPKVQIIYCKSCGRQMDANAAFCGYCGARRT